MVGGVTGGFYVGGPGKERDDDVVDARRSRVEGRSGTEGDVDLGAEMLEPK